VAQTLRWDWAVCGDCSTAKPGFGHRQQRSPAVMTTKKHSHIINPLTGNLKDAGLPISRRKKNPELFPTKLSWISWTNARLFIQIICEFHVWKTNYSTGKLFCWASAVKFPWLHEFHNFLTFGLFPGLSQIPWHFQVARHSRKVVIPRMAERLIKSQESKTYTRQKVKSFPSHSGPEGGSYLRFYVSQPVSK